MIYFNPLKKVFNIQARECYLFFDKESEYEVETVENDERDDFYS